MTSLRLQIDHLVLDGVDAERVRGFPAALEAELELRLASRPAERPLGVVALEREISAAVAIILGSEEGRGLHG